MVTRALTEYLFGSRLRSMRLVLCACLLLSSTALADPPKTSAKSVPVKVVSSPSKAVVPPKLPDRVSREDALEIEVAQLKVQAAQRAFDDLVLKWNDAVVRVGKKYQFDRALGDDVDFQTGEIKRVPRKPPAKVEPKAAVKPESKSAVKPELKK